MNNLTTKQPTELTVMEEIVKRAIQRDAGVAYEPMRVILSIKDDLIRAHFAGSTESLEMWKSVDAQIFDARKVRVLYLQKDQKVANCRSLDGAKTGTPHPELGLELNISKGQVCKVCPYAQWFEKPDPISGKMKRQVLCKERRSLAAVVQGFDAPVVISISPTGRKNWDEYVNRLVFSKPPSHYIKTLTNIKVTSEHGAENDYGVPVFTVARELTEDEALMSDSLYTTYRDLLGTIEVEEEIATESAPAATVPAEDPPF